MGHVLSGYTRSDLSLYFKNTFELDDILFQTISDQSYFYLSPNKLRLPLIFYFGHTAVFYVNKMLLAGLIKERINFDFETIFETGVDEMTWDSTEHNRNGSSIEWPSVQAVKDYRSLVKVMVLQVIETAPFPGVPITKDSPWWSLLMGIEHQRIHIETTSVLLKQFPVEYLKRPTQWKYAPNNTENPVCYNDFIKVKSGDVTFGKAVDSPDYGWDIDYGEFQCLFHHLKLLNFSLLMKNS